MSILPIINNNKKMGELIVKVDKVKRCNIEVY